MRTEGVRRAAIVLAGLVVAVAVLGLWYARNLGFTEAEGAFVYPAPDDYVWARQFQFNPLGALVTLVIAVTALVGAVLSQRALALGAAGMAVIGAGFTVVDLTSAEPVLGGRAGNVALLLVLGVGLAALELTPPPGPATADREG